MMQNGRKNILDFGAVGDGKTVNTEAIQKAIDTCEKGETVYIPTGVFVTGALFLKSNMTLYLEEGSVLLGSGELSQYPVLYYSFEGLKAECYASLLNAGIGDEAVENLTLEGKGTVNANGVELFFKEMEENRGKRGRAIFFSRVTNLTIRGITIRQSPAWCLHLLYCNQVEVKNVHIFTKYDEEGKRYEGIFNGDGLDIDSCCNVMVQNCVIASQDDCIAIKSGRDQEGRDVGIPSEHIYIRDCEFHSGFGIAVGSEMSGGVRDVKVSNCQFHDTFSIASIKAPRGRGNVVENIYFENCTHKNESKEHEACKWFRGALYIDQFYGYDTFDVDKKEQITEGTPKIRNIFMKNIQTETVAGHAVYIVGLPEMPIQNVVLEHICASGEYGLVTKNVEGLIMKDMMIKPE